VRDVARGGGGGGVEQDTLGTPNDGSHWGEEEEERGSQWVIN
jgi:hypothetical protein